MALYARCEERHRMIRRVLFNIFVFLVAVSLVSVIAGSEVQTMLPFWVE